MKQEIGINLSNINPHQMTKSVTNEVLKIPYSHAEFLNKRKRKEMQ